ncbi:MAG TPA: ATP synthase F1 subunit delta [Lactobacillaceae bacterium]|jgi:F-type H+-transporting ATPase subunit delta
MANIKTIRQQYVRALFELATETQTLDAVVADVKAVQTILADVPALADAFGNRRLTAEQKLQLAQDLTKDGQPSVTNLIKLLVKNHRATQIKPILVDFIAFAEEKSGILHATLTTAVPVDDDQLTALQTTFAKQSGAKHVVLTSVIDPEVLGGVRLQSDTLRIDGTIQTQLARIQAALKN